MLVAGTSVLVGETMAGDAHVRQGFLCGPRCVERVLQEYGQVVDLSVLSVEIMDPQRERASSLRSLAQALRKRGVHSKAVTLPAGAFLNWQNPVILHLTDPRGTDHAGHFVVAFPTDNVGIIRLWDGIRGESFAPTSRLVKRMSGSVLLTAPKPINEVGRAMMYRTSHVPILLVISTICAFAFAGVHLFLWYRFWRKENVDVVKGRGNLGMCQPDVSGIYR